MSQLDNRAIGACDRLTTKNKLAFATGDIYGGGTFNLINFLFVPFLTLVLGIPMIWASPLLLLTKVWDGIIDPFIGAVTDGKKPGKYGKRRYYMLLSAPAVLVGLMLLFFPWNLVTNSLVLKVILVAISYMMYATAQSFVLIPYYSLGSEMTDNYTERNKANAMRLVFSITSSLVCVAVPGMIASPDGSVVTSMLSIRSEYGYIIMTALFGALFVTAILICAINTREQIVYPPIRRKITLREFFKPLKSRSYRKYLGMHMSTSMAMAIMSGFFFIFSDFVLRRDSYLLSLTDAVQGSPLGRFPIGTVAAACMFVAQAIAVPLYLRLIKKTNKKTTYIVSGILWATMSIVLMFVPSEPMGSAVVVGSAVVNTAGVSDILFMILGLCLGLSVGGCVFVPHTCFGDVCDATELQFGQRTEGSISGLTNFLNTVAQAIGLALPPAIMSIQSLGGYVETQYITGAEYQAFQSGAKDALQELGMSLDQFFVTKSGDMYKLLPMVQSEGSQLALRLTFALLPIVVIGIGMIFASRYRLTMDRQARIVQLIQDRDSMDATVYQQQRDQLLAEL